jgi:hypothetical protein
MKQQQGPISKLVILAVMLVSPSAFAWSGKASRVGDMVYKGTSIDTAFVGHAGVLYGTGSVRLVADVTDGRGDHALGTTRSIGSFENDQYLGSRRFKNQKLFGLTSAQQASLKGRIAYFGMNRMTYDFNHLDQKGTWFNHNFPWEPNSHWEFDCVGFVERILEDIGLNPTANSYESGLGWPLTPSEQRDSSNLTSAPWQVTRTIRNCANASAIGAAQTIDLTNASYTNYTCASRYQEQCINDGSFDQYYDETCI